MPDKEKLVGLEWGRLLWRTRIEVVTFVGIIVLIAFLLPRQALIGLMTLLASKVLGVMVGIFFAHITRIIAFPYLDLNALIKNNQWAGVVFLAIWYGVIVYAVAMGG